MVAIPDRYQACTIVARNYLAQARVLARSFSEHHPDINFSTLVIDGVEADRDQPGVGSVVLPSDLDLDPQTLHSMMTIYDVMELATALKPALLASLVRARSRAVAYFDPDIRVFAPLHDVFASAEEHGVFLTPHALHPLPRDGRNLTERNIMQAGIYNLGFVAVGARAYSFLLWWHQRLTVDAIVDIENALFTDQRWIDWVPALFPHVVSRDQGLNVAYWNLHERPIRREGDRIMAGESVLRFYHFSGYDPEVPWLLSKHMGDLPRTLLSDAPELRALCEIYRAELEASGHMSSRREVYGLNVLPNGLQLSRRLRRYFRKILLGEAVVDVPPPDPFDDPDAFAEWLITPALGPSFARITPAEYSLWDERADLRQAFPDILGHNARDFLNWVDSDGTSRDWLRELADFTGLGRHTKTKLRRPAPPRKAFGWSVIGYANSELGIGEAGRRMASVVAAAGVPMEMVGTRVGTLSRQGHRPRLDVKDTVGFENAISCVNADQTSSIDALLDLGALRGRKTGLWFWELEDFPPLYARAFALLHEVWVTSAFTQRAVAAATDTPVRLVKLPIEIPKGPTRFSRRLLSMPQDSYVFLTNFDYLSVYERKNPIGVIRSFMSAFGPGDGATLIVKSINGFRRPLDVEHVRSSAMDRPDILFLDDYVSSPAMKAMIELADCYISLHRSEGFGLNLADAMAHGTPTIATGYSGNMDFMTPSTSELIPFAMREVGDNCAPYDPGARWAEPDLDAAASAMRKLFDDPGAGWALADRALLHVRDHFSLAAAADVLAPILIPALDSVRSA